MIHKKPHPARLSRPRRVARDFRVRDDLGGLNPQEFARQRRCASHRFAQDRYRDHGGRQAIRARDDQVALKEHPEDRFGLAVETSGGFFEPCLALRSEPELGFAFQYVADVIRPLSGFHDDGASLEMTAFIVRLLQCRKENAIVHASEIRCVTW